MITGEDAEASVLVAVVRSFSQVAHLRKQSIPVLQGDFHDTGGFWADCGSVAPGSSLDGTFSLGSTGGLPPGNRS